MTYLTAGIWGNKHRGRQYRDLRQCHNLICVSADMGQDIFGESPVVKKVGCPDTERNTSGYTRNQRYGRRRVIAGHIQAEIV